MGFTACQVDEMSLWQLLAQVEGYSEANTTEDKKAEHLSDAEVADIGDWLDSKA